MKISKNDIESIFSWKSIKAYLKGNRKGKDAHNLEKAASEDPFLEDAIEGFDEFKDDPSISSHLKEIEKYVEYRKSQEKAAPKFGNRMIALAASFTLLISASLWIWFSLFNQVQNDSIVDIPDRGETQEDKEFDKEPSIQRMEEAQKNSDQEEIIIEEPQEVQIEPENKQKSETEAVRVIPATKPDATAYKKSAEVVNKEAELEVLIAKILEMEKDFWLLQKTNSLALNDMESTLMEDQAAPSALEETVIEEEASPMKKRKSNQSTAAGASASEPRLLQEKAEDFERMNPIAVSDSLIQRKILENFDSVSIGIDMHLLKGVNQLYKRDTVTALNFLQKATPRSESQQLLIDSLIGQLSR